MPALYEIHWLADGRKEEFTGSRGNYYEFSETDRLDLHSEPVWCRRCAKVTHGEELSTVEEIEKQIRELYDPTSERYRETRFGALDELTGKGEEFLKSQVTDRKRRLLWRISRKSPPKCIHCGSTEIVVLPMGKPIPNPTGSGELLIDVVGMCSTKFNEWFFTPEGDRIPRDTHPTYWYHPDLDTPEHRRQFQKLLRSLPRSDGSDGR